MFPFSDRSGPDHTFCYVLYANTSHHSRVRLGLKILFCFAVLPRPTSHNHTTDIPPCPPHQHVYKHTTPQHTYRHNAWILQAMVTLHTSILGAREMFETSSCNALFTVFGHRESIIKSFPFFSCTKKRLIIFNEAKKKRKPLHLTTALPSCCKNTEGLETENSLSRSY